MKKTLLVLISVICCQAGYAQGVRVISGVIKSNDGTPIPGVNVMVKGTSYGVATDANGYYRLNCRLGDVIIFSFVGFLNRELEVTRKNSKSVYDVDKIDGNGKAVYYDYAKAYKPNFPGSTQIGVGVLNDSTPTYKAKSLRSAISHVRFRKPNKKFPNGRFLVKNVRIVQPRYAAEKFEWIHKSSFQLINRLPKRQNTYAQGRPANGVAQWRGAELGEKFSWGPAINTLNFDNNIPYAYDQNGSLTAGGGTLAAQPYDPTQFFRTGFQVENTLNISREGRRIHLVFFQAKDQRKWSAISGANSKNNSLKFTIRKAFQKGTSLRLNLHYNRQSAQLPNQGFNWQNTVSSVLTTPPTFDQANGLTRRDALGNSSSYLLNDGSMRSPAPGLLANPYGIVNQVPDKSNSERFGGTGRAHYFTRVNILGEKRFLEFDLLANFDVGKNSYLLGQLPQSPAAPLGRMIERTNSFRRLSLSFRQFLETYAFDGALFIEAAIHHDLYFERQVANRRNAFGFTPEGFGNFEQADNTTLIDINNFRRTYQISPKLKMTLFEVEDIRAEVYLGNKFYFSSTLPISKNEFFLPDVQLKVVLDAYDVDYTLYLGFAKNLQEAPLLYNQWQYNSTNTSLANYAQYFESEELGFNSEVSPEMKTVWSVGFGIELLEALNFNISYQNQRTSNLLKPVFTNGRFAWANVGEMQNNGFTLSIDFEEYFNDYYRWSSYFHWKRNRPVVTQLYNNATSVPLAGYREVGAHLVANQPYGVIYGTQYLRDAATNQLLIGNDGFPIADPNLVVIGDPNPEWILQWTNAVKLNRFKLEWTLAYQHGGQRWNGTRAMMDYLGVSQETAQQRNIRNYIFPGVNLGGTTNNIPVDFASADNGLAGNRWVRYGAGGVAADYLESASSLRFEDIRLTYQVGTFLGILHSQFSIGAFVQNLLLFAPYRGFDPRTSFLSSPNSFGLDLFNAPATTSVGLQLKVIY